MFAKKISVFQRQNIMVMEPGRQLYFPAEFGHMFRGYQMGMGDFEGHHDAFYGVIRFVDLCKSPFRQFPADDVFTQFLF